MTFLTFFPPDSFIYLETATVKLTLIPMLIVGVLLLVPLSARQEVKSDDKRLMKT